MIEREALQLNGPIPSLEATFNDGELTLSNSRNTAQVVVKISELDRQENIADLSRKLIAPAVDLFKRLCAKRALKYGEEMEN